MTPQVTVMPEERALIVDTGDPARILQQIPTAFQLDAANAPTFVGKIGRASCRERV